MALDSFRHRWHDGIGALGTILLLLGGSTVVSAHEGPPFPILVDQPAPPFVVSVWADPDIGEARFFILVEKPEGGPPSRRPEVSMWTQPLNQRLPIATYHTEPRQLRNQLQFEAHPYFDQRDQWVVGFRVTAPGGEQHELTAQIESTPPGYGPWDLAVYLFPFALLGGMWILALRRRRHLMREQATKTQDVE